MSENYKEDRFEQEQLVIARFLITHCVADASIVGFLTELPFIIIANWTIINEPEEQYIYPINIRIL